MSRLTKIGLSLIFSFWLSLLFFAEPISKHVDKLIGSLISEKSRALVPNSELFILRSIFEGLAVAAIGALCVFILFALRAFWVNKSQNLSLVSIKLGLSSFVLLNIFIFCAAKTTIFWLLLYVASPTYKQPFFETNRTLISSSNAAQKAVIVGSSQGQSQFEIGEFNHQFYPSLQFANFSYPGASAWDFQLIFQQYKEIKPSVALIYLSEMNIYQKGPKPGRVIPLSNWSTIPIIYRHISAGYLDKKYFLQAIYSLFLPSYKIRRSLEVAVLGSLASNGFRPFRQKSQPFNIVNPRKLENYAQNYGISDDTEYQKKQFFTFIDNNLNENILPIVIIGQVNPILEHQFPDELKSDFYHFVQSLKSKYTDQVVFVDNEKLRHSEQVYDDYMHINREERLKYTKAVAAEIYTHLK